LARKAEAVGRSRIDQRKGDGMKIVVIGGTGLIGSKLVEKLRGGGHEAVAASPDTVVDTNTGEGLTEALQGAEVVVDVANAPNWDDAAVMDFVQASTHNVLKAEVAAGVGHHVVLSVAAPSGSRTAGTSARRSSRRSRSRRAPCRTRSSVQPSSSSSSAASPRTG
jgi:nucleoside-diphosphate-sugar epimerase